MDKKTTTDGREYFLDIENCVHDIQVSVVNRELKEIVIKDAEGVTLLFLNVEKSCLGLCKMVLEGYGVQLNEKA